MLKQKKNSILLETCIIINVFFFVCIAQVARMIRNIDSDVQNVSQKRIMEMSEWKEKVHDNILL